MTRQRWAYSSAIFLNAALSIFGSIAYAADTVATAAGTLEEIVVTAQKRSEGVQDVPVSVTVLSNEELSRQGVQAISDLSHLSASLEFTAGTAGGGGFIRGIGTEGVQSETSTGSVSVVLDGVVLGNTSINEAFDINRIEILKGPQGTLFGSSVSAGVINITTNAPDPAKAASTLEVEYGSPDMGSQYSRRDLRATANLPLTDTSAIRFAFHADDFAGFYHNPTTGLASDEADIGARVRYLWHVNDDLTLNLIGDYNKDSTSTVPILTYRVAPPGSALAVSLAECGVTPGPHNFDTCSQYVNQEGKVNKGLSAQADWVISGNTLTSITALRKSDQTFFDDIIDIPLAITEKNFALAPPPGAPGCHFFDCLPIYSIFSGAPNKLQRLGDTLFTQELRLASAQNHHFEWLTGLYYQHFSHIIDDPGSLTSGFPPPPFATAVTDQYFTARVHSQDYAGFANVTYYLTDTTRLIAGARVTHSTIAESKYDPSNTGNTNTYSLSTSVTKPTFRLGVQQQFAPNTMGYVTLSTGYQAPEISDDLSNGKTQQVVKPALPAVVEIGVKHSAFDNRLAIDADIFYQKVKDFQGQTCTPGNQGLVCVASSVPTVTSKGLEVDIFGRPLKGLTLNLTGILNPATYPAGYLGQDGTDLGGKQLNYASKTKVTFSAEQTIPVTPTYSFVVGADAVYRSAQSEFLSAIPEVSLPANTIFNARFGLRSSNNWSVYAFGRNIGKNAYPILLFPNPVQNGGYWQQFDNNSLRVVGLQLEAKF